MRLRQKIESIIVNQGPHWIALDALSDEVRVNVVLETYISEGKHLVLSQLEHPKQEMNERLLTIQDEHLEETRRDLHWAFVNTERHEESCEYSLSHNEAILLQMSQQTGELFSEALVEILR